MAALLQLREQLYLGHLAVRHIGHGLLLGLVASVPRVVVLFAVNDGVARVLQGQIRHEGLAVAARGSWLRLRARRLQRLSDGFLEQVDLVEVIGGRVGAQVSLRLLVAELVRHWCGGAWQLELI